MEGLVTDKLCNPFWVSLLLPAFLVCVLLLRHALLTRWSSKLKLLPPGPSTGLPFIGHFHLLGSNPHQSLSALSKTHGPLMFLRFGSIPVVVASTPSAARQILQVHDQAFSFRNQTSVPTLLFNGEDIVFSQPGPYRKLMRQIWSTDLVSSKRLEAFRPLITEEVHALCCSILGKADEVPVREELHAAMSYIMSRMAMGKRLVDLAPCSQADPSHNLVSLVVETVRLLGIFNVGDFVPCLAWMDLQGCAQKTRAVVRKLHTILQEVIDGRREMHRQRNNMPSEGQDLLDVLMTASERWPDIQMKDSNIMAILMDMFIAGIDTSAISTEWALCELLKNPIKMKKLQDELDCVVGTLRLVQETDIPHLPYLRAVVKETLRLHPVAPLLAPHKASQECNIFGYRIPAGTLAFVNVWAIGRDPVLWEKPLEFSPERFLGSNTDVRGQHFELLPFGSGRRACPGLALGLINIQYMLASIVHCFDWSTRGQLNMSERFGIVMTLEKPLIAKAVSRLPTHLFKYKQSLHSQYGT